MSRIHAGDLVRSLKQWLGLRGDYQPALLDTITPTFSLGDLDSVSSPLGIPWACTITSAAVAAQRSFIAIDTTQTGRYIVRVDRIRINSQGAANTLIAVGRGMNTLAAGVTFAMITDSRRWLASSGGVGGQQPLGLVRVGAAANANITTRVTACFELEADGAELLHRFWLDPDDPVGAQVVAYQDTDNVALRVSMAGYVFPGV